MILSYQEEEKQKQTIAKEAGIGWIREVYPDGVTLDLGDGSAVTQKHSKVVTGHTYARGMMVYTVAVGGNRLVIGPIGNPETGGEK